MKMSPCRVAVTKLGTAVEFDFAGNLGSLRVGTDVRIDRLGEVATTGLLRWALGDETLGVAPIDRRSLVTFDIALDGTIVVCIAVRRQQLMRASGHR